LVVGVIGTLGAFGSIGCAGRTEDGPELPDPSASQLPASQLPDRFVLVLGVAQDAGYPQAGCDRGCCRPLWSGGDRTAPDPDRKDAKRVSSLAIVDRASRKFWLIDATPDFREQLRAAQIALAGKTSGDVGGTTTGPAASRGSGASADAPLPAGIFLTHAHTGHYTGLTQLGREAIGARGVPVHAMPRMAEFLKTNGPWSQLVSLGNVDIHLIAPDSAISLADSLTITPFLVPHRDEFSETAGFEIRSGGRRILYIPDIDKWEKWERDLTSEISRADYLFLDGTFYDEGELKGRSMAEVPHPLVTESMRLCAGLSTERKGKVHFIHLNHTNPLLRRDTPEWTTFMKTGFRLAAQGQVVGF
jgi:pyrroloquinoline quinone biosynthesis protein B